MAQVCPVVGTTTTVLPPNHPTYDHSDPTARCPITNATVSHHDIIHSHPSAQNIPNSPSSAKNLPDASACPALKNANSKDSVTDATCPVVGPVSAVLPPSHPSLEGQQEGSVCPITNAKMAHHGGKVHEHPAVAKGAEVKECPVVGKGVSA
ncbi:hypothetical protein LTR95_011537 [Oleoguttula sp. CCFEE 5521]